MRFRLVVLVVLVSSAAFAQQRTFVSANGNDANPCSLSAPCRNFAAALAAVLSGGEVVVLDSAGYGPVSITNPVSLVAPTGVYGGITAFTGDAITVNAKTAVVVVRGLTLNAVGIGANNGINVISDGTVLHVENCVLNDFVNAGINVTGTNGELLVTDTTARGGVVGIQIAPASGVVTGAIDHCHFAGQNSYGVYLSAPLGSQFVVSDSTFNDITLGGLFATGGGVVNVQRCVVGNTETGLASFSGSTVSVSDSMVTFCSSAGFRNNGAIFRSFGNNQLADNTANTAGFILTIAQQ
jgi:parallel beta helix pectate lyase-like protein